MTRFANLSLYAALRKDGASRRRAWLLASGQRADSAVPMERHTDEVTIRLSPRLREELELVANCEETSVSEVVREALAARWGIK